MSAPLKRPPPLEATSYYTKSHEYFYPISNRVARVGITSFAIERLGEVVFVDVSSIGKSVKIGDDIANLESVKAVGEVYSPVNGTVVRANPAIIENTQSALHLINKDPEGEGWLAEIQTAAAFDLSPESNLNLLDHDAYLKHCEAEAE